MVPGAGRNVCAHVRVEAWILHSRIGQVVVEPAALGQLGLGQPQVTAGRLFVETGHGQRHRRLDMVPGVAVAALEPRDHPVGTLDRCYRLGGRDHLARA